MTYKAPLSIQVIWHPAFEQGKEYAKQIYGTFMRPLDQPLKRGPGIQVFFRDTPVIPPRMELEAGYRIYVLMVEPHMIIDKAWKPYLETLQQYVTENNGKHLIIPVRATDSPLGNPAGINAVTQQILLHDAAENIRVDYLLIRLTHVVYRFLHDTRSQQDKLPVVEPPHVQLFLSHAKKDGKTFTKQLNDYIRTTFGLDTFFDALDIETGYPFDQQLKQHAGHSALIVIQTDAYSSRPWCRKEIIAAKTNSCPIVVFNKFTLGEERSFPYMSNVSVVHLDLDIADKDIPATSKIKVVRIALTNFLRFKYQAHYLAYLNKEFNTGLPAEAIFPAPPELLTLLSLYKNPDQMILYPDPLLGDEETDELKKLNSGFRFVTPPLLPLLQYDDQMKEVFRNTRVAISISGSEPAYNRGFADEHLQDVMVDVSRYLLAAKATLVYGGSLHQVNGLNFTQLLLDLVYMYNTENDQPASKAINYTVFPYAEAIDTRKEAELLSMAEIRRVPIPADITVDKQQWESYIRAVDPEKQAITARLLTLMRQQMNEGTDARIFLGGKVAAYDGTYPGVLEEFILALNSQKAIYLIGAYGGCAGLICDCLFPPTDTPNVLAQRFANELRPLQQQGWAGLNNGLSEEENQQLATTRQVAEITQLILKGLATTAMGGGAA